jgi:hypothetical protein
MSGLTPTNHWFTMICRPFGQNCHCFNDNFGFNPYQIIWAISRHCLFQAFSLMVLFRMQFPRGAAPGWGMSGFLHFPPNLPSSLAAINSTSGHRFTICFRSSRNARIPSFRFSSSICPQKLTRCELMMAGRFHRKAASICFIVNATQSIPRSSVGSKTTFRTRYVWPSGFSCPYNSFFVYTCPFPGVRF